MLYPDEIPALVKYHPIVFKSEAATTEKQLRSISCASNKLPHLTKWYDGDFNRLNYIFPK